MKPTVRIAAAAVLIASGLCVPAAVGASTRPGSSSALSTGAPMNEQREMSSVIVSGRGEVAAKPDRAVINTGVGVQEPTAEAAMRRCAQLMQSVVDTITKLGIPNERVQTAHVSLTPVYDQSRNIPEGREPRIVGYRADNTVRVQIEDLTKIGPVLDAVVKSGANQAFGISFEIKDDKAARSQALRDACTDARAKAATIAESLGMTLGELLEVNETGVQITPPRPMPAYARMALDSSTPISPGEVSVDASVTIRYALIKK